MGRSSIIKIALIGTTVAVLAGASVYWYKRAEPKEIIPEITSSEIETSNLDPEAYSIPRTDFTLHPPIGWEVDTSGGLGTYVVFINPSTDTDGGSGFNANITVTHEENINYLEDFARKTREALPQVLENYVQTDNRRVRLGETEGHLIGGTFTFERLALRTLRLLVYENNVGYAVTATTLESAWEKYASQTETVLRTFQVSNP